MKKYFNKKIISLTATILLILIAVVGTTFAYYSDATASVANTFTVGSVETVIEEDFDTEGNKDVTIKNVGESDCYIRARISISPQDATVSLQGLPGADWVAGADGFYYYTKPVSPQAYTESLFDGYSITDFNDFVDFEVTIYQEAVQAAVYDAEHDQHVYSMTEAWAVYDDGTN